LHFATRTTPSVRLVSLSGSGSYAYQKGRAIVYRVSAARSPSALKLSAMLRMLRISLEEGVLVEVRFQNGEGLDGYWVCSLGKTRVGFSNATIEENREAPILVPLEGIRRVSLLV